jgi:hypothetical protein
MPTAAKTIGSACLAACPSHCSCSTALVFTDSCMLSESPLPIRLDWFGLDLGSQGQGSAPHVAIKLGFLPAFSCLVVLGLHHCQMTRMYSLTARDYRCAQISLNSFHSSLFFFSLIAEMVANINIHLPPFVYLVASSTALSLCLGV